MSAADFLELTREFDCDSEHSVVAPFADAVRKTMELKLPMFK